MVSGIFGSWLLEWMRFGVPRMVVPRPWSHWYCDLRISSFAGKRAPLLSKSSSDLDLLIFPCWSSEDTRHDRSQDGTAQRGRILLVDRFLPAFSLVFDRFALRCTSHIPRFEGFNIGNIYGNENV